MNNGKFQINRDVVYSNYKAIYTIRGKLLENCLFFSFSSDLFPCFDIDEDGNEFSENVMFLFLFTSLINPITNHIRNLLSRHLDV